MVSEIHFDGEGRASYEKMVSAMLGHWGDISEVTTRWYSGNGGNNSTPLLRSMLSNAIESGGDPSEWHFCIKFKDDDFAIWFKLRYS